MTDFDIQELSTKDENLLTAFWSNLLFHPKTASEFLDLKSDIISINLQLRSEGSIILGEIEDEKIRGIAVLDLLDITRGWLKFLIVLPQYRRQGIGNALITRSESVFLQNSKKSIRVPVYKISLASQTLLKRFNYDKLRETPSGFLLFEKKIKNE